MGRKEEGQEETATIEELFASLDEVVEKMESADTSLEESFGLYQKGMQLLDACNKKIDKVEKELEIIHSAEKGE